jgi:osmotically-inducible protein OsmY
MKIALSLVVFASMALVGGCANSEWTTNPSPRYYGMVDLDQTLEQQVRAELDSHPDLAATAPDVLISAQNGTVTLSGAVPNEQTRQEILAVVRNGSGMAVINDQLVAPSPYTPTGSYGRPPRVYVSPPGTEP